MTAPLADSAAATAATATGVDGVTTAVIVDEQQYDDHQQNPVAVVAAKQVTQTHTYTPFILIVCARPELVKEMYITPEICLYFIRKRRRVYVSVQAVYR